MFFNGSDLGVNGLGKLDFWGNASRFNWITAKNRFKWTIHSGIGHHKLTRIRTIDCKKYRTDGWRWREIPRSNICLYQGINRLSSFPNMTELHRRSSAGTGGSPPGVSRSRTAGGGGEGKGGLSAGCQSLLSFSILLLACVCGFSSRLFAVIRFESLIHEFDPWWGTLYRPVRY